MKMKTKKKKPAPPLCFLDLCFALWEGIGQDSEKQSDVLIIRSCCSALLDFRQLQLPDLIPNNYFCFTLFCAYIFSSLI